LMGLGNRVKRCLRGDWGEVLHFTDRLFGLLWVLVLNEVSDLGEGFEGKPLREKC
jgi:hypothetical protein